MAPDGKLTTAQFEIMQLIWDAELGLTVGEIWDAIRAKRDVSRTTVLNLVDRLEKRGWLARRKVDGTFRYRASVDRERTERKLAAEFVSEFFGGSPTSLFLSLLGSRSVSRQEIQRIRKLLNDDSESSRKKGDQS
ncbi:MAG: BlaI/MecI/CopY family transcriptional regulator [Planctomycetales bacterium]|nr:BlaI/MecI/CopY family transcriptional regulator [Planctomycetales bacterium]